MKGKVLFARVGIVLLTALIAVSFFSCGQEEEAAQAEEEQTEGEQVEEVDPLKIAFAYIGVPGDLGWTYEHDRGREYMVNQLGDKVETTYIENVPEGPDAARIFRQYAQQGYDMIYGTSFGYMDPMNEVAQEFPDTIFMHCSGYKTEDNMATYFGRIYQPRYLSGLVAGSMTEEDFIGYVAAFPIPEVIRGINAFTLGVQKVNPEATVKVVWTNTWYDPVKEREAAVALLDSGVDILAQHQDTTEPPKAAEERGKYSIGYHSDMAQFVGDGESVLTSAVWNFGPYYTEMAEAALDGTWESHSFWGGMDTDVVKLADFSPLVPEDVRDIVEEEKQKILAGEWDVFWGPIKDQSGNIVLEEGEKMSDSDMLNMSYFVEGVQGSAGE